MTLTVENLLEQPRLYEKQKYHPKDVQTILQLENHIREHISEHLTIEQLSQEFSINRDKLQNIFKSVYGKTIKEHTQQIRMNIAYNLLIQKKQ